MRFWDSSALLPLVLAEPRSPRARAVLAADAEVVLWWSTPVECASALARRARAGEIALGDARGALEEIARLIEHADVVQPEEAVRARALRLLRVHPLGAADAFQLAAALVWTREEAEGAGFVCFDERLQEAARREGFAVVA
jgi:uncharacterized protein